MSELGAPIIAVFGHRGSGKTTLIERILRDLSSIGYRVAVAKHVHHRDFAVDVEGKDTWRYARAGAKAVAAVSAAKLFIVREVEDCPELDEVLGILAKDVDLVLIEGFRHRAGQRADVHKIVVARSVEEAEELLQGLSEPVIGVYGDLRVASVGGVRVCGYGELLRRILDIVEQVRGR